MPVIQPPAPRYKVEDLADGIQITLPSRKHWIAIFALFCYLLVLWALLIGIPLSTLSAPADAPTGDSEVDFVGLLLLLAMALIMVALTLYLTYILFWNLFGKEIITANQMSLSMRRKVLIFGRVAEYLVEHIMDLRVKPVSSFHPPAAWMQDMFLIASHGTISFEYGAKTFHFGSGADEAEANRIIRLIQDRFPQYRQPAPHS